MCAVDGIQLDKEKEIKTYFVSVDEKTNRSRGYVVSLAVSGDGFGVRKRWGRVDKVQERWILSYNWDEKVELFNNYQEALILIESIKRKRQRHGYVVVENIEIPERVIQLKLPL